MLERIETYRSYVEFGYRVWKTQGTNALVKRIYNKLFKKISHKPKAKKNYSLSAQWQTLEFPVSSNPTASIIIPVFNKSLYTFTCLQSILEAKCQTTYEIIVVDDHSSDDTPRMLNGITGIHILRSESNRGFIASCNAGADMARGENLVFLNNDTIVTNHWLDNLISTLQNHANTAIAGAKLLFSDGTLQEAGGIVWQDGSAWNYGRGDDPEKPEYCYARDVDYCSGACLAIPKQIFYQLGKFDTIYSPAYYEDTDLCLKAKTAGYKVIYQPASTIVHFEGVSSGKNLHAGIKKHQIINQKTFHARWLSTLHNHKPNGESPYTEKERSVEKRILIIDACMLTPDQDSGSFRMWNLIKIWQKLGFKVTFAADNLQRSEPYSGQLQMNGVEVLYNPYTKNLNQHLKSYGNLYDIVLISRPYIAEKYVSSVRKFCKNCIFIYDTVDLHYLREKREAEMLNSKLLYRSAERRKKQEISLVKAADITLVVSGIEKDILSKEIPEARVEILSNIHHAHGTSVPADQRKNLLFIGAFRHPPNIDAAIYFSNEVFPLVKNSIPGIKLFIVGSHPSDEVRSLQSDDIIVTGYVENLLPFLERCRVFVAPLRYGAGVKGKINTAMSHGLPVVATSMAIEGMHLSHGTDIMIADNPPDFCEMILKVHSDDQLWDQLSKNGISNINKYFSSESAESTIRKILSQYQRRPSGLSST